jgi:acyl dehydratase
LDPPPPLILGEPVGPFEATLSQESLSAYAHATRDPSPVARSGGEVLLTSLVTQIWTAQNEGRTALISDALQRSAQGVVHGEHDIVLYRPPSPGETLRVWVEGHGARRAGRNALVTLRYTLRDDRHALVAEQWWTTVYIETSCPPAGKPAPAHAFPEDARSQPLGTYRIPVDAEMAQRYADVSGDRSPHHFDPDAARASGVDRPFLHGLCTMALCAQAVTQVAAGGDPSRIRRIAVRFAAPTFLDEELEIRLYESGPSVYAFEATCAGEAVVTNGRAELK